MTENQEKTSIMEDIAQWRADMAADEEARGRRCLLRLAALALVMMGVAVRWVN